MLFSEFPIILPNFKNILQKNPYNVHIFSLYFNDENSEWKELIEW